MKIAIKNQQKRLPVNPKDTKEAVLKTLALERVEETGEITICLVSDRQIRKLNLMYLGQDCPTDVISFDLSESKDELLADIIVSCDTAIRNSKIFKTSPAYEIVLYVIHGLLHILGYNDKNTKQRKIMDIRANYILNKLNMLNPNDKIQNPK